MFSAVDKAEVGDRQNSKLLAFKQHVVWLDLCIVEVENATVHVFLFLITSGASVVKAKYSFARNVLRNKNQFGCSIKRSD